jgi:hypothetical protein
MSAFEYYEFYLEVKDLKDQAHVVTVESVRVGEFYDKRKRKTEKKIVLRFVNRRKSMILNKTQAAAVMDITGTDDEKKWIGAELVLMGGRASNGQDTIVVTTRADSGDADLMFPSKKDTTANYYKELFQKGCDRLGLSKEMSAQILGECENEYRTATERLTAEYGHVAIPGDQPPV